MSISSATASYPYDYASLAASEAAAVSSGTGDQSLAVAASNPAASEAAALLTQLGVSASAVGGVDTYV